MQSNGKKLYIDHDICDLCIGVSLVDIANYYLPLKNETNKKDAATFVKIIFKYFNNLSPCIKSIEQINKEATNTANTKIFDLCIFILEK